MSPAAHSFVVLSLRVGISSGSPFQGEGAPQYVSIRLRRRFQVSRFFGGDVELYFMADERVAPPGAPTGGYATLGPNAPIAWPSGFATAVPVTGQLSPHAQAALERMGITKSS
jgi:hypothetical protein